MSHRMTDGRRFAILVPASLAIGVALCFVAGVLAKLVADNLPSAAPVLVPLVVIGALALSCWSFIWLVNRLYRDAY
jgi:hypothetical protein